MQLTHALLAELDPEDGSKRQRMARSLLTLVSRYECPERLAPLANQARQGDRSAATALLEGVAHADPLLRAEALRGLRSCRAHLGNQVEEIWLAELEKGAPNIGSIDEPHTPTLTEAAYALLPRVTQSPRDRVVHTLIEADLVRGLPSLIDLRNVLHS